MARLRGTIANVALASGVTLAGLAGIEAYLRWRGTYEINATPGCYAFSDNPRLMYDMKPHCEGTNAWGMRDHEIDPTATGLRIAALGDSVTYGPGVPIEATWPKHLQRLLTRAGIPATVLNFAVQGYSTVQEVETLRVKALRFDPRIVLLQYCFNDEDVYTTIFDGMVDDMRRRQGEGYLAALDPRHGWLVRRILLSRTVIATRLALARLQLMTPGSPHGNAITDYYKKHSPVREGLVALRKIARANDLRVLVLIFPHAYGARADRVGHQPLPELTEYPRAWVFDNRRILALCRELGFTCIDLAQRLHDDPRLLRLPGDRIFTDGCCHLTALGNKVMAWIIYKELAARRWV